MLVAVAPDKFATGVSSPEDDWRATPGSPANRRKHKKGFGVPSPYSVTHVSNALSNRYATDAHLVMYVMRDAGGRLVDAMPRITKAGLPFVESLGFSLSLSVLTADVDNPNHCEWTDELRALAIADEGKLETAGVYYTAHGRRIVQPLTRSIPVAEAEGVLAGWLRYLEDLGLHPDWSCKDWTRHMRVPHATVRGKVLELPVRMDRMVPIDPPTSAEPKRARPHARADRSYSATSAVDGSPLAKAFEDAGWLGPKLGADKRAVLCPFRASHSIGKDFDSSTVLFAPSAMYPLGFWWCSHGHCASRTQSDVIAALPPAVRARLPRPERNTGLHDARALVTKDEARQKLERAFREAPDGLSVVVAGCGVGKTEAALAIAADRASKRATATGRAPLFSKTAVSVPTTKLALELAERVRAKGVAVRRFFGPLAAKNADGSPTCVYHDTATAFSRGGLSIPWEFCQGRGRIPCDHADTCAARDGVEGPEDARVVIGPHALLSQLDAAAGTTGLLVIDEPPALLEHEVLEAEQLRETARALDKYFDGRYAAALRPALDALARWIGKGTLDEPGPLSKGIVDVDQALLEEAFEWTGEADAVACVRAAFRPPPEDAPRQRTSTSPPVSQEYVHAARRHMSIAKKIGETSRVARIVWAAIAGAPGTSVARLEERGGRRVLVVTLGDLSLRDALVREGSVVVADANGRLHLPIYANVVGYQPPVTEVHVGDGAEVTRLVFKTRASRSGWFPHGRLDVGPSLVRAVRIVVDWLLDGAVDELAAIVTLAPLELALRAALGETVRPVGEMADKLPPAALEAARTKLGPELRRLRRVPDLGHFGAIRGLDHWRGHGALVTLGDPWPQLADARWEAEFLTLPRWEERLEGLVAAELEQAHGRLRTVHRTSQARALHVGSVVPGGWAGAPGTRIKEDVGGRRVIRETAAQIRDAVAQAGSIKGAARALGLDVKTVRRAVGPPGRAPVTPASSTRPERNPSKGSDECVDGRGPYLL